MAPVKMGKRKRAVVTAVVCGSGLLLLLLGLRAVREHDEPSPAPVAKDTADSTPPDEAGPKDRADTGSSTADSLPSADMEQLAGSDTQTLADALLKELPLPGISKTTGNLTNLTPAEEARAIALWKSEKNNWSRLRGFSGNIDIDYLDAQGRSLGSLKATIRMRVCDFDVKSVDQAPGLYPPRYEMVLADRQGRWTYTCDGTNEGSKLVCHDESLAASVQPLLMPEIAVALWGPSNLFLNPGNSKNPSDPRTHDFWEHHQPMRNPDFSDRADCYMFAPPPGSRARNIYFLENGHLARAVMGPPQEKIRFQDSFEGYEQVDGFAFPTKMSTDNGAGKRILTLSDVKVQLIPDG